MKRRGRTSTGRTDGSIALVVRTSTPPESALPMLRQALWSLEPGIVFTEDVPAQEVADTTVLPTRIGAMVHAAFGALALLLAAIGLYGVVAYSVSRRTREVGIRIALGAQRREVLWTMAARGGRLALIGIAIGGVMAAAAGNLLESMLYGVSAVDAIAFAAAAGVMLIGGRRSPISFRRSAPPASIRCARCGASNSNIAARVALPRPTHWSV